MTAQGETARRVVHFAMGGLAFLLPYLTPMQAACAAGAAVLFNLFLLPHVGPSLFRRGERESPWRSGVVIYPATVLLLVILFHRHMEIAGAAWAILAAGDSAAGWIGRRFGRTPIPWNRSKTVEGSCAFAVAAFAFSWAVLVWMGRRPLEAALLAAIQRGYDAHWLDEYPQRIRALTVQQVNMAIKQYIDPARLVVVEVGSVQ